MNEQKEQCDIKEEIVEYQNNSDDVINETYYTEDITVNNIKAENIEMDALNEHLLIKTEYDNKTPLCPNEDLFNNIENLSSDIFEENIIDIESETDYEKAVVQNSNHLEEEIKTENNVDVNNEPYTENITMNTYNSENIEIDTLNVCREIKMQNDDDNPTYHNMNNANSLNYVHGKQFECHICKKSFAYKHTLNRHMVIHTGEKPFKCQQCVKSFARKDCWKMHMFSHTRKKNFICKICLQLFDKKQALQLHISTHLSE